MSNFGNHSVLITLVSLTRVEVSCRCTRIFAIILSHYNPLWSLLYTDCSISDPHHSTASLQDRFQEHGLHPLARRHVAAEST